MEVSVIVPVFNNAAYVGKCIESILNQSFADFELIIIDDGSTDESFEICSKYEKRDKRVHVIKQANNGVSSARNRGLEIAKGKFVAFVDSDDEIHKDYLKILYDNRIVDGLVACKLTSSIDALGNYNSKKILNLREAQISVFSNNGILGFPFCKLFDMNIIRRNKVIFDTNITICEDVLFAIEYLSYCHNNVCFIDGFYYYYYINFNGATQSRWNSETAFKREYLTEVDAIKNCKKYLAKDKKVLNSYEMRLTKASVNTLRCIVAKKYNNRRLYKNLLKIVRKNVFGYLASSIGARSSKISVLLSAFSPKIEFFVFRSNQKELN